MKKTFRLLYAVCEKLLCLIVILKKQYYINLKADLR